MSFAISPEGWQKKKKKKGDDAVNFVLYYLSWLIVAFSKDSLLRYISQEIESFFYNIWKYIVITPTVEFDCLSKRIGKMIKQ